MGQYYPFLCSVVVLSVFKGFLVGNLLNVLTEVALGAGTALSAAKGGDYAAAALPRSQQAPPQPARQVRGAC